MIGEYTEKIADKIPPVGAGLIIGVLWLAIFWAAMNLSGNFSLSNSRVQMVGVIVNSFLTTVLIALYAIIAVHTSRQADIQKEQKRMMEFQSGARLDFRHQGFHDGFPAYQIHNRGPGIVANIGIELKRKDTGESCRTLLERVDGYGDRSPSFLRAGESTEAVLPARISTDEGCMPVPEFETLMEDRDLSRVVVQYEMFAENGSGEESTGHRLTRALGTDDDSGTFGEHFKKGFNLQVE